MFVKIDAVQLQTQPIEISGLPACGFWLRARGQFTVDDEGP